MQFTATQYNLSGSNNVCDVEGCNCKCSYFVLLCEYKTVLDVVLRKYFKMVFNLKFKNSSHA